MSNEPDNRDIEVNSVIYVGRASFRIAPDWVADEEAGVVAQESPPVVTARIGLPLVGPDDRPEFERAPRRFTEDEAWRLRSPLAAVPARSSLLQIAQRPWWRREVSLPMWALLSMALLPLSAGALVATSLRMSARADRPALVSPPVSRVADITPPSAPPPPVAQPYASPKPREANRPERRELAARRRAPRPAAIQPAVWVDPFAN